MGRRTQVVDQNRPTVIDRTQAPVPSSVSVPAWSSVCGVVESDVASEHLVGAERADVVTTSLTEALAKAGIVEQSGQRRPRSELGCTVSFGLCTVTTVGR